MAFSFSGVSVSMKVSEIRNMGEKVDFVIEDHFTGDGDFFCFLIDNIPHPKELDALKESIKDFGLKNYVILNCVNQKYNKDELRGTKLTTFLLKRSSDWVNFLKRKGQKITAIMAFGPAIYSVNGMADIQIEAFYADYFIRPYYYMGHSFRDLNTHIFPVDALRDVFPSNYDEKNYQDNPSKLIDIGNVITYKTRFFRKQLRRMVGQERGFSYKNDIPDLTEPKLHIVDDSEEIRKILKENMNSDLVAWDIETNGLKFYDNFIVCITICWNGVDGYFFPFKKIDKDLLSQNILSCKRNTGANPKFDTKFLWYNGFSKDIYPTDAIDMLSHCIHSERKRGLKPLTCLYTSLGGYEIKLDKYKESTKCTDYSKIPQEILAPYAIIDAIATWRVQQALWKEVDDIDRRLPNDKHSEWSIRWWYEYECMPIYQEVIRTEYKGIYVNMKLMDKYRQEMQDDISKKEAELRATWGVKKDFNIYSTQELGKLFEKLGFTCHGMSKLGYYATNDDAIQAWVREGQPGVKTLAELRNEKTAMNSFLGSQVTSVEEMYDNWNEDEDNLSFGDEVYEEGSKKQTGWLNYIHHTEEDDTDRIFQSYNVMGTTSFRFIGKDPNFQNIPTRGKYAPMVKKCIDTPKADLYTITSDSGKEYKLAEFEYILTNRGYVKAINLTENDSIIEDSEKPVILKCGIEVEEGKDDKTPEDFWFRNVRGF